MGEGGGGAAPGQSVGERAAAGWGLPGGSCLLGPMRGRASRLEVELRYRRPRLGKGQQRPLLALPARVAVDGLPAPGEGGHRGWCGGGEAQQPGSREQPGVQPPPVGGEGLM